MWEVAPMWGEEEDQPTHNRRLVLAIGIGLLLLLVAGCVFVFPFGFVGQTALAFSKRAPSIIASKMYVNPGQILALQGDSQGFWRVWEHEGVVTVNRFSPLGEVEWVGDYNLAAPLLDINGQRVILADSQTGQVYIIENGKGLVYSNVIGSKIQTVAIAGTGQWLAVYLPQDDSAAINTEADNDNQLDCLSLQLAFHSADGAQLFVTSLENSLPIVAAMNQNGTQMFLMMSKVCSSGLENHLFSYADTGQLLWTAQLPAGPPVALKCKPFGDRVAVAIDKTIVCYSGTGQPLWQHVAQGIIQDLSFLGQGDHLAYGSQKVSVLSFQKQAMITALNEKGAPAWQYQVKGSVPHLTGGTGTLSVFLANDEGTHSIGADGKVRWSQKQERLENTDKVQAYIAVCGEGTVLLQLTDGRMFVLRGE